jgi:hypothetical protein
LPLESRKCGTSHFIITLRATPSTTVDQTGEQDIQPRGSKKYEQGKCKTVSDWPESEEEKLDSR